MEAKEKAKELVEKFTKGLFVNGNPNHVILHAKQCALICVDEIIKALEGIDDTADDGYGYWGQVRNEIEKL